MNLPAGIDGRTESTGTDVTNEFAVTSMRKFVSGNLESKVDYEIKSGPSIRTIVDTDLIVYENMDEHSGELNGNYLVLYEDYYDCFQHNYIKD